MCASDCLGARKGSALVSRAFAETSLHGRVCGSVVLRKLSSARFRGFLRVMCASERAGRSGRPQSGDVECVRKRLAGKPALVTGASRGIGAAVAKCLGRAGAHLILLARTQGALEEVDDALRSSGAEPPTLVVHDLRDFSGIDCLGARKGSALVSRAFAETSLHGRACGSVVLRKLSSARFRGFCA